MTAPLHIYEIALDPEESARIDELATELKLSRSQVLKTIVRD